MTPPRLPDSVVAQKVAAVAARIFDRLPDVTADVFAVISDVVVEPRDDERINQLRLASLRDNLATLLRILRQQIDGAHAPPVAVEYARVLAQRGVGMAALMRAYRIGQARFQHDFISELLREPDTDHLNAAAALHMVDIVSAYVDTTVEELGTIYEKTREEWISHDSGLRVERVRTLLGERGVGIDRAQQMLGSYRLEQHHLGAIVSCSKGSAIDALPLLSRLSLELGEAAGCVDLPLFIPNDERSAWIWFPLGNRGDVARSRLHSGSSSDPTIVTIGEPLASLAGFRRTHEQAMLAYAVAISAQPRPTQLIAFADVAPVTMMCADLDAARTWVTETLGALAIDDDRASLLRETALVFLDSGCSFTKTAERMILHRNTAQYRIQKAEDLRGRPLRDGRLEVELALLACHYLGRTVLQSSYHASDRSANEMFDAAGRWSDGTKDGPESGLPAR